MAASEEQQPVPMGGPVLASYSALMRWASLAGIGVAGRRLLQSEYCPTTAREAFAYSLNRPSASSSVQLNPYSYPYTDSCRTWKNVRLVYADEFYNVRTGATRTGRFTYTGSITEVGTDSCSDWAMEGYPATMNNQTSAFFTLLSTSIDKPYEGGSAPVSYDDVCLETFVESTGQRTNLCGGSSAPWRLRRTYIVSVTFGSRDCCDYGECGSLSSYQPYLTGSTSPSYNAPSPSRSGNGTSGGNGTKTDNDGDEGGGSSSKSNNTGVIVGAVVGAVGGLALLVGLGVWCVCRRRRGDSSGDLAAAAVASIEVPGKTAMLGGKPGPYSNASATTTMQMGPMGAATHSASSGLPPPVWGTGAPSVTSTTSGDSDWLAAGAAGGKRPKSNAGMYGTGPYTTGGLQTLPETAPVTVNDATVTLTSPMTGIALTGTQSSLTSTTSSGQAPSVAGSAISVRSSASQLVLADHMRIRYDDLRDFVQIGQGGFGNVFKCKWQGHQVVVKMLRADVATDKLRAALVREALLMRELQHPAVARVYGVVDEAPHHALVMQLYKRGTLEEFMTLPATSATYDALSVYDRLRMAGQVADGMAYLHQSSPPIIHGDLKAANLLVDEDNIAITDFGLAVQLMTSGHGGSNASCGPEATRSSGSSLSNLYSTLWTSPTLALSVFISPPEVLSNPNAPRSTATDVYAFGITLLQIMTGRMPYKGLTADMVVNLVKNGRRPGIPETLPFGVRKLIEECWTQDPAARPTMRETAERIKVEMAAAANATLATTRSYASSTRSYN